MFNAIGIYKITNLVNNKCYIGKSKNIKKRFYQHRNGIKSSDMLQRAIKKYGLDNFSFDILEETDADMLDIREIYWIDYFNAFDRNFGYNLTKGGNGGDTVSFLTESEYGDFCKKVSDGVKNSSRHYSDETKKRVSEAFKGQGNPMYGKHISEKHKDAIRQASKGRKKSKEELKKLSDNSRKMATGRVWINNGICNKFIKKEELSEYLNIGYVKGMLKK